jgi:hypothetical protein
VYRGSETNDGFIPTANSVNRLSFGTGLGLSFAIVLHIVVSFFHGVVCQVL